VSSCLLDTNAYTDLLLGDAKVLEVMGRAEAVCMSVVVVGELLSGFRGGTKRALNEDRLRSFLSKPSVRTLGVTLETADCFSQIWHALRKAGTPIPLNDAWIAAHAIETGSVLVTRDAHFSQVPGLRIWERS
jgi:tRNA(fMet)-specific endonuclease VapC